MPRSSRIRLESLSRRKAEFIEPMDCVPVPKLHFQMERLENPAELTSQPKIDRPYSLPEILLGASAYTASGWEGSFYPKGMRSTDYLAFYAAQFATVEVDSTFYGNPSPLQNGNLCCSSRRSKRLRPWAPIYDVLKTPVGVLTVVKVYVLRFIEVAFIPASTYMTRQR